MQDKILTLQCWSRNVKITADDKNLCGSESPELKLQNMSSRYYPLYKWGNPQLRIFLPNFWMKIVKSKEPLPPNMVLFQTSLEMTNHDVKNYLEKIYNIKTVEVKTTIKQGLIRRAYGKHYLVKDDDYKEALVTLPRDQKFEFPEDAFVNTLAKGIEDMEKLKKDETVGAQKPKTGWFF